MDENKQIDGMARLMCKYYADDPNCCRCPDCWVRDEAKVLYEAGYRKQEWISVEDALPEVGEKVLLYSKPFDCCDIGQYSETFKKFFAMRFNGAKVTHWMPLPSAPKGE